MKDSIYQRRTTWTYRFRIPEQDLSTGEHPRISKGDSSQSSRHRRHAETPYAKPLLAGSCGPRPEPWLSSSTSLSDVQLSSSAIAWSNWNGYAHASVPPRIGGAPAQRVGEPQL
jgi:hypothetical protein